MNTSPNQPAARPEAGELTTRAIALRLRMVASRRAEEFLAEVPATLRRLRTLLLALSISVPIFLIAVVAVLWHWAS